MAAGPRRAPPSGRSSSAAAQRDRDGLGEPRDAQGALPGDGIDERQSVWLLFGLFLVTIAYTLAGLIGVVLTDFLQFGLALAGVILAVMAIDDQGDSAPCSGVGDRRPARGRAPGRRP